MIFFFLYKILVMEYIYKILTFCFIFVLLNEIIYKILEYTINEKSIYTVLLFSELLLIVYL